MDWNQVVNKVKPYIVRIKTPAGSGSGFLCLYNHDKTWCGVATASHVINHVDEWRQPIKLIHQASEKPEFFLDSKEYIIMNDPETDSAIIFFKKPQKLLFPKEVIRLRPLEQILDIGSEVAWLGYPYLEKNTICFFSGCISARNENRKYYLMDGVAINGVSGGPVLYSSEAEGVEIIGIISSYIANNSTGSTLPGLSVSQDVFHLHKIVATIQSIDEAKEKKQELERFEPARPNTSPAEISVVQTDFWGK